MEQMDKYSGKRLDGRYELQSLIGAGGMALVYKAYDTIDDRMVAVKILKDEYSENTEFLKRFRNESKAIAVLSHPNIVKVYDVSFGDVLQYIVMEYIEGITLKEYLSKRNAIPYQEAMHFTLQILSALQHAHNKGIIHRDIKPQNIMLLQDGTVKVTDFGIARFSRSETRTMTDKAIGSVHYIAPEQARGDFTDERADIYSLGVMLYEIVTGQLPFNAESAVSVAIMQLQSDPKPPREINSQIPQGLEEIILKAMQKNPSQRYQSASGMLRDLEAVLNNPEYTFGYHYISASSAVPDIEDPVDTVEDYDDDFEYVDDDGTSPSGRKVRLAIKGVLLALAIMGLIFGGLFGYAKLTEPPVNTTVLMPDFVGLDYSDILSVEEYEGVLNFEIKYEVDTEEKEDTVLRQDPVKNTEVKVGASVVLYVNGGTKKADIPDLSGYTQEEAENALRQINLVPKIVMVLSDEPVGHVVTSSPAAYKNVPEGTTVKLYVSGNDEISEIPVPAVIGYSLGSAKSQIQAAGFSVGSVTEVDDTGLPKDTVIEVDPLPGVRLAKGSTVHITVSSGKMTAKKVDVKVNLPTEVPGDLELKVYINGTLFETKIVNPSLTSSVDFTYEGTDAKDEVAYILDGQEIFVVKIDYSKKDYTVIRQKPYEYTPPVSSEPENSEAPSQSEPEPEPESSQEASE